MITNDDDNDLLLLLLLSHRRMHDECTSANKGRERESPPNSIEFKLR
jgi:hypothetical protein